MSLQKMLILNIQCSHHKQKAMGFNDYYNSYLFDKAITWTTDDYAGEVNYRGWKVLLH
ncbi:hypothetical protein [Mycoplasmopsis cynos]|uniref:hypothetical protein n=1 Tax=Mycoplasmopsis cynos TaxID=171284 RepID=UPI00220E939A|nr:hypothetical protein [Mycoplasmopsis cynos]UWV82581.1 hypothetical protein NW067_06570 [Mycoplasmopsis cynos]